jgi:hypothetical protein
MRRLVTALSLGAFGLAACASAGKQTDGSGGTGSGGSAGAGGATGDAAGSGGDSGLASVCRLAPPCPSGWYQYTDTVCSPPSIGSGPGCGPNGDGLCYQPCKSSADCGDPAFPNCTSLYVFAGSDVGQAKYVCTSGTQVLACPTNSDASFGGAGGVAIGTGGGTGGLSEGTGGGAGGLSEGTGGGAGGLSEGTGGGAGGLPEGTGGGAGGALGGAGGSGSGGAGGGVTKGTPCSSIADCGNLSTMTCRAPGEFLGCGNCIPGTSTCANDSDCVPDAGTTTAKMICDVVPRTSCSCEPAPRKCVSGCRSAADCAVGEGCNSLRCERTCVPGDGTCATDFSCNTSGFCARNSCTSDAQCSVACVKGYCYDSRGQCDYYPM